MDRRNGLKAVDQDILDTINALFPGASTAITREPGGRASFRFVPSLRSTHMLVPADAPRAARLAVDRRSAKDTRRRVALRGGVRAVLTRPELTQLVMPHVLQVGPSQDSLLDHLEGAVGAKLCFSMAIGSRRANRKPVLSVHTLDGLEIGYAKVGLTQLANDLIDHEAGVLAALNGGSTLRSIRAPRLIHHGGWNGSRVLLMSSLRPTSTRTPKHLPVAAIAELSSRDNVSWGQLKSSRWISDLRGAGTRLRAAGDPQLSNLVQRYEHRFADVNLPLGAWHGDLGPWNMAWDDGTALIWDWERAQGGVPVGIDAVHYTCHSDLRDIGNLRRAMDALTGQGQRALEAVFTELRLEGADAQTSRAVLLGYLLTIATRFSVDSLAPDGAAVGELARWHLTVLDHQLGQEID